MKRFRTPIVIVLALFIVAACFFLPTAIFLIQDVRLDDNVELADVDEVDLSLFSNLSMVQKLILANTETQTVLLETGRFMDSKAAVSMAKQELTSLGLWQDEMDYLTPECSALLKVSENDRSLVLWSIDYSSKNFSLSLFLDDETGKILSFESHGLPLDFSYAYDDEYTFDYSINSSYVPEEMFYEVAYVYIFEYLGLYYDDFIFESDYSVQLGMYDEENPDELYYLPITVYPDNPDVYFNVSI